MAFDYKINPELTVPIYRQLNDAISADIKKGVLESGKRLPTVNELSYMLGVSRGTVKRTYDELEQTGLIEKVQGRGTFVSFKSEDGESRKERAMTAIDELLNTLEGIGFSVPEINIFLNLKMRQRSEQISNVKVAFIECNTENLLHISEQLRKIKNLEIYPYLLESIEQYPYKLDDDFDLIVTTEKHSEIIDKILPVNKRVVHVALRLTPECLSEIVKLRPEQNVGILCVSLRFGTLLKNTCTTYTEGVFKSEPFAQSKGGNLSKYIKNKNVLLISENFESYCSAEDLKTLKKFKGQFITCTYELDEGSFIYLREKSKRILESKTL